MSFFLEWRSLLLQEINRYIWFKALTDIAESLYNQEPIIQIAREWYTHSLTRPLKSEQINSGILQIQNLATFVYIFILYGI